MSRRRGSARRRAALAAACLPALAVVWLVERGSEERANRLHRARDAASAVPVYVARTAADSGATRVRYNLGTALLELGSTAAGPELERAAVGAAAEVREPALYNLGLWHLRRALGSDRADSVRSHAARSVEASKSALKLRPGTEDTRWNLALAQRMLDSIDAEDGRAGTESVDGARETDDLVLSDDLRELEEESDVTDAPTRGSDEAPAWSEEGEPLSLLEARRILGSDHLDPGAMVRKLLTFEGRLRRASRTGGASPRW